MWTIEQTYHSYDYAAVSFIVYSAFVTLQSKLYIRYVIIRTFYKDPIVWGITL